MAKKIIGMFLGFVLVTVLGVGAYAYTIYQQSTQTLAKTYKQIGEETKVIEATEPLTILLMGVDTGNVERTDPWAGNSDSMILVTVNPKTKKVVMMSLERDILTQIQQPDGSVREAKLNAAYADGGAELAISTIQKMMNIHIDRYVMVNMHGLQRMVDAVGGITVNNTLGFPISIQDQEPFNTISIGVGEQTLNGDEALVYSRMRYQDPEGDYGRQKRQREVIKKVVEKVLSLNSVSHYQAILKAVSSNMQTNIALDSKSIPQLLGYQDAFKNIKSEQLRGEDATLPDGGSYQLVTSEHLLSMQNLIRKSLGLDTVKSLKTNAVLYEDIMGGNSLRSSNSSSTSSSTESYSSYQNSYSQPTYNNGYENYSYPTTDTTVGTTNTTPVAPAASSAPAADVSVSTPQSQPVVNATTE